MRGIGLDEPDNAVGSLLFGDVGKRVCFGGGWHFNRVVKVRKGLPFRYNGVASLQETARRDQELHAKQEVCGIPAQRITRKDAVGIHMLR
ncbi:hypothetical protein D3C86_1749100 [compost metagenome]